MSSLAVPSEADSPAEPGAIQRARIGGGEIVAGWAIIGALLMTLALM